MKNSESAASVLTPVARPTMANQNKEAVGFLLAAVCGCVIFISALIDAFEKGDFLTLAAICGMAVGIGILSLTPTANTFWSYIVYLEKRHAIERAEDLAKYTTLEEDTREYLIARRTAEIKANDRLIGELVRREFGGDEPTDTATSTD